MTASERLGVWMEESQHEKNWKRKKREKLQKKRLKFFSTKSVKCDEGLQTPSGARDSSCCWKHKSDVDLTKPEEKCALHQTIGIITTIPHSTSLPGGTNSEQERNPVSNQVESGNGHLRLSSDLHRLTMTCVSPHLIHTERKRAHTYTQHTHAQKKKDKHRGKALPN